MAEGKTERLLAQANDRLRQSHSGVVIFSPTDVRPNRIFAKRFVTLAIAFNSLVGK